MSRNPSVSLTDHHQEFIAELVDSGRFHGVSEVVRAGLRLLEQQEEQRRALVAAIEEEIRVGLASGTSAPLEPVSEIIAEDRRRQGA